MIRFIDLTGQIYLDEKEKSFAFFDTITDKFCEFNGCQQWDSVEEFKTDYEGEEMDRFLGLIPKSFFSSDYGWKDVKLTILGEEIDYNEGIIKLDKTVSEMIARSFDFPPLHFMCGNVGRWQRIENLKELLKNAVAQEDFSEAHRIQEEINKLKEENLK